MQVTKIVEGGIDLITGQKLEAGIVISNGLREITVAVSLQSMEDLAILYADGVANDITLTKTSKGNGSSEVFAGDPPGPNPFSTEHGVHGTDGIPNHDPAIHGPVFVPVDEVPLAPEIPLSSMPHTAGMIDEILPMTAGRVENLPDSMPTPTWGDDEYSAPPVSTDHIEEASGFEAGEEYDDSGTGVGSL